MDWCFENASGVTINSNEFLILDGSEGSIGERDRTSWCARMRLMGMLHWSWWQSLGQMLCGG